MKHAPAAATAPRSIPWGPIAGIIATVSVFALAQGLSYPLLAFILERQGASAALIGGSAAMTPLGIVLSAPFIPRLAARLGAGRVALACATLSAALLALVGWTYAPLPWFPLRFLLGCAINPLYVLSEVWLITLVPPERRGRLIGLYATLISGGFAVGPVTLAWAGTEGWMPFGIGVAAFLACGLCLAVVLPRLPPLYRDGDAAAPVRSFIPLAPVLLLAVFVAASYEGTILSLLPVYGFGHGLPETQLATLLAVFIAGNVALQVPLGIAAERWSARRILLVCAAGTIVMSLGLIAVVETPLLWPLAFLLGAVSYGIYTIAILELGERFSGVMLVAGNAAFSMTWGVGALAGPPIAGTGMDLAGIETMPLALAAPAAVLLAAGLARRR